MLKFMCHLFLLIYLLNFKEIDALGCMQTVCSNDAKLFQNKIRPCSYDGFCGNYKSISRNGQLLHGVELACNEENYIYAPFNGEISYYQPYSGAPHAQCADHGVLIEGLDQWRGYYALISTVKLYKYGGRVKAGDKLGVAGNLECINASSDFRPTRNYVRIELFRNGQPIDPTYHLIDCMCTGQICETNYNNALIGAPFKRDNRYNGVQGWELQCPKNIKLEFLEDDDSKIDLEKMPKIFSPIEGNLIGRIRLDYSTGTYAGCSNDGLFIIGTGKWTDYEARLFNVKFRKDLEFGNKLIKQGDHIGYRLNCKDSSESIFFEIRFQGALLDISEAINAKSCEHKKLNNFF